MGSGTFGGIYYGQYSQPVTPATAGEASTIDLIAFYQGEINTVGSYDSATDIVASYQATVDSVGEYGS